MKSFVPLLLSAALLTNTVACSKPNDKVANNANSNQTTQTTQTAQTTQTTKNTSNTQNSQISVPAGTSLDTVLQKELSTGKNSDNEPFTLRVKNSVKGVKPDLKNAEIQGHIENVVKAAKGKKASLRLVFDEITLKNGETYPIDAALVNTQVETKTKGKFIQNAGLILGGAVAGHFIGKKTNVKHGGLGGAAAATAYVLSSPGGEVVLKRGTNVKLKLKSALASSQ
ncbi:MULTISPECIES: hypothetical protein [unclassified Tolypothrix]|uniref:hypothetical protein n=1 Tax=unclassified Tolypothrix TaxID=2649714 RepID=UPI0005EAB6B4|nr:MULTISPECIES: hypothetical protein [unclassified Tolypothrix]BAY92340.1 hypothetical protein NIES3275_43740 [Microchaete diplosiphon NIES-3275]EKE98421.1 hypothetical protein FDUTEX481_04067 [Tolypothrix sp. PCC 7601]MBE9085778.1 hypothetical protein [Tolypothrix sp. LEGE 11397]UYD26309.1 hypothetical protein HGR01_34310 [Tolypothrix sp. PCC 7712]UYD31454.1 hypothetical protein HG267_20195 [Tolypothrix sp. PCC 7601]